MSKAKPEHRAPLEKLIADKWQQIRETNDLQELRAFVRMFGAVSDAGKEARLQLVERLMDQPDSGDEHPLLEAELELSQLRSGRQNPVLAGRATEALARLYTRKGLLEDAAYCYRKLGKDYADIVIRDGKTGRQIYDDDAATDKRLLPYLDDAQPLSSVKKFTSKRETPDGGTTYPMPGGNNPIFQFEQSGERLPFFRHHIIGLSFGSNDRFVLLDRNVEDSKQLPKEVWSDNLGKVSFQQLVSGPNVQQIRALPGGGRMAVGMMVNPGISPYARFPYETVGHLIILPLGNRVFAIDPINHRRLWDKDLLEGSSPISTDGAGRPQLMPLAIDPRDGSALVLFGGMYAQRLGQVSPFLGQTVLVQTPKSLSALDPLSGRVLWSRLDVNMRNYLFSDEEYVFVVELDNQSQPNATRVFRAADGSKVQAPDFAALFGKRLQVFGRHLLLSEAGANNSVLVRLYDVVSGKDVWKQSYPTRSIVGRSEDATLTAVVEPDGKVHVIDLQARKEVVSGALKDPVEHWKGVEQFTLLSDRSHFYLAPQAAAQNAAMPMGMPPSNVMTHLGMRSVFVNGWLNTFDRGSGENLWWLEVKNQYLILDQFQDLPLLFLTAHTMPNQNMMAPGMARRVNANPFPATVMTIQKKDCRVVCNEQLQNATNFFGIRVDPRARTVELLSQSLKITHYPAPPSPKKGEPSTAAPPRATPSTASLPQKDTRIPRPAFERAGIREIVVPPSR
jgi:hypothetical protein